MLNSSLLEIINFLLVEESFEELESKLVEEYIFYFGKLLPSQYSYTYWLDEKFLPFRVNLQTYSQPTLCFDSISIKVGMIEPKKFLKLRYLMEILIE